MKFLWLIFIFIATQQLQADIRLANKNFSCLEVKFSSIANVASCLDAVGKKLHLAKDKRGLFAEVYAITMVGISADLQKNKFKNKAWVEQLFLSFGNIYREILANDLSAQYEKNPIVWNIIFNAQRNYTTSASTDLMISMKSHISRDLVFALIKAKTDFQSRSQYSDFLNIAKALKMQTNEIWKKIDRYGSFEHILPAEIEEKILVDWAIQWRIEAWQNAKKISSEKNDYLRSFYIFNVEKKAAENILLLFSASEAVL